MTPSEKDAPSSSPGTDAPVIEKRRILRALYSRCGAAADLARLDELVGDSLISLERAGRGHARDDLVRAHEQLDIVSAAAQALARACQ